MKYRLQGDKRPPASDGRMPGLTSEQPRRNPRLQDGFLCVISHCRKAQGCGGKDSVERGNGYKAFLLWLSGLHARLANIPCLKK